MPSGHIFNQVVQQGEYLQLELGSQVPNASYMVGTEVRRKGIG